MILKELPDCKKFHALLTIGKEYKVLRVIGNGVVIQPDDGDDLIVILTSRFEWPLALSKYFIFP